jgi:hypothetical protein
LIAEAVIFRCEMTNGSILYQQLPCISPYVYQVILPIIDTKSLQNTLINKQEIFDNKYINNSIQKVIIKEYEKQLKQKQKHKKAEELKIAKANRRLQRCQEVNVKIKLLQNRLHSGYTARQEMKLNEQFIHYTNLQHKYCEGSNNSKNVR